LGFVSVECASGETVNNSGGSGHGGSNSTTGSGGKGGSSATTGSGGTFSTTTGSGGTFSTSGSGGTFSSGTGGSSTTTGAGGTAGTTGFMPICMVPVGMGMISDLESGQSYFGVGGCPQGSWYVASAGGGMITAGTAAGATSGALTPVAITDRPPSTMAIHVAGGGQANTSATSYDAYVSISASLNRTANDKGAVNASAFTGIQFYGKITAAAPTPAPSGSAQAPGSIRIQLAIPATDSENVPKMCTKCDDDPGAPLTPSAAWMLYKVPFSSLAQEAFGDPASFSSAAITKVLWKVMIPNTGMTPNWDIWIDDLAFY
jgi:hypothetical protein